MKKTWTLLIVYVFFLAILIGATFEFTKKDHRLKVMIVSKTAKTEYWRAFNIGAERALNELGLNGKVIIPNSGHSITSQADLLNKLLKQHPDALVIAPIQSQSIIPILMEYKKRNIPVLLADTDVEWKDKTSFIGTDNFILGKKAGALLASMLQPGDQVALIHGMLSDTVSGKRIEGAKESLEEADIQVVVQRQGYDEFWNVNSAIASILQSYPNIKGVFATDDLLALDTLQVIEQKGLKVPVVGTEGNAKMVKYIKEGKLSATIAQNPYDMGYISVEQAFKTIKGEKVRKSIDSGTDIITRDNAKDKLDLQEKLLRMSEGDVTSFYLRY
ncbi:sugar ABC transporter substrate-binding protein [Ectobacillus funiculus]|uniref:Sugar ABC transporter substrate-binding protein n=1 Tax=Ectobacillus funiculus TaxID=137993 RepID=A0ABV5WMY2_9BACI